MSSTVFGVCPIHVHLHLAHLTQSKSQALFYAVGRLMPIGGGTPAAFTCSLPVNATCLLAGKLAAHGTILFAPPWRTGDTVTCAMSDKIAGSACDNDYNRER